MLLVCENVFSYNIQHDDTELYLYYKYTEEGNKEL